jgi:2-methylcitrate dehydratase PrpD
MIQPYIDCARRLRAQGIAAEDIAQMVCEVGEGTVHRLWEPLADKQRPPNGYAAKFAAPYCIAAGILREHVGLDAFSDAAVSDGEVRALAAKVRYEVDPANPYPRAFTGHIRARLADGRTVEERQPHMRGGASEPLSRAELEEKFAANMRTGGWGEARAAAALALVRGLWSMPRIDLGLLR